MLAESIYKVRIYINVYSSYIHLE